MTSLNEQEGFRPTGQRSKVGRCTLCGARAKLTKAHVPPKAAFNNRSFSWGGTTADSQLVYGRPRLGGANLYAHCEHDLRKVGFSKERRVDPQIVVGLLVDRTGFPLEIACFEGSQPETHTIIPVVTAFQERNQVADMVVVADAGMLSNTNLTAIDEAGLRFIVGSRVTKAPHDLAKHFHWHGDSFTDGQVIDTITMRRHKPDPERVKTRREPVWHPDQHPQSWRAVWQYSRKRAVRDGHTLTLQENRALDIIEGRRPAKKARFVKTSGQKTTLDTASLERARALVGLKGYVTNITADVMPPAEVIASYHDLWHVEQSFRMSKTDLAARPIFHRTLDAIEGPPHHRVHRPGDRPRPPSPIRMEHPQDRQDPPPAAARHH